MKTAWRTMAGIGLFVLPFAIVYGVLSGEESGTILLVGVPLSMLLLAAFLFTAARRAPSPPEDRTDGVAVDGDEIGVFPSASIWPAVLGLGMTLTAFGFAYSAWLALPGLGVLVLALGGFVVESGRVR
jgi:hypothetical protein